MQLFSPFLFVRLRCLHLPVCVACVFIASKYPSWFATRTRTMCSVLPSTTVSSSNVCQPLALPSGLGMNYGIPSFQITSRSQSDTTPHDSHSFYALLPYPTKCPSIVSVSGDLRTTGLTLGHVYLSVQQVYEVLLSAQVGVDLQRCDQQE